MPACYPVTISCPACKQYGARTVMHCYNDCGLNLSRMNLLASTRPAYEQSWLSSSVSSMQLPSGASSCRKEAYTCWNQASSARVNNYGTRIDLILLADAAQPPVGERSFAACWVASNIEPERSGSDHAPAWADYDHPQPLAKAATPPALSSRFLFTGMLL